MSVIVEPELWYAALATEIGIILRLAPEDDPVEFKSKLYALRQRLDDGELESLSLMTSGNPREFWLVKNATERGL